MAGRCKGAGAHQACQQAYCPSNQGCALERGPPVCQRWEDPPAIQRCPPSEWLRWFARRRVAFSRSLVAGSVVPCLVLARMARKPADLRPRLQQTVLTNLALLPVLPPPATLALPHIPNKVVENTKNHISRANYSLRGEPGEGVGRGEGFESKYRRSAPPQPSSLYAPPTRQGTLTHNSLALPELLPVSTPP